MFSATSIMDPEMPSHKEGCLSMQCLKCRPSFILQDEGMSESPVEILEKAIVLNLFWTQVFTYIGDFESCAEFKASKDDDA